MGGAGQRDTFSQGHFHGLLLPGGNAPLTMVAFVLPSSMSLVILEYVDAKGVSRFARWFQGLDPVAAAKVAMALIRLEKGNWSTWH